MCDPQVLLNMIVLDLSYVLIVVGASMVFKARSSPPGVWISFGMLSTAVGGFLFYLTYHLQTAAAAVDSTASALAGAC